MASNRVHIVMLGRMEGGKFTDKVVAIHRNPDNAKQSAADLMKKLGGLWFQDNTVMGGGVWSRFHNMSSYKYSEDTLPHVWIQSPFKSGLNAEELALLVD